MLAFVLTVWERDLFWDCLPVLSPGGRRSMILTLWPFRWASMAKLRPAIPPPTTKIEIPVVGPFCAIVDMFVESPG